MALNFEAVRKSVAKQGLDLQGIMILHEGLTDAESLELSARGLGRGAGRPGAWL